MATTTFTTNALTTAPAGSYRTNIRDLTKLEETLAKPRVPHHADLYTSVTKLLEATHQNQEGNPKLFCELTWDLVKGTGVAEGKEVPIAMPAGREACDFELDRREKDLACLKEWDAVLRPTNFEGVVKERSFTELTEK